MLAHMLPPRLRPYELAFPLLDGDWRGVRAQCVAVLQAQPHVSIDRWLPGLRGLTTVPLHDQDALPADVAPLPSRMRNALLESLIGGGRALTWSDLAKCSVTDLERTPGIGVGSLPTLLEFIVDVGVRCVWPRRDNDRDKDEELTELMVRPGPVITVYGMASGEADDDVQYTAPPREAEPPNAGVVRGLMPLLPLVATIGAWAVAERGVDRIEDALQLAWSDDLPSDVREVVSLLRAARFTAQPSADMGGLIDTVLASLPEVRRTVFEARVLQPSSGTLEAVGERIGVTRERVRQIEVAATRNVREQLALEEFRWLRWRAHSVRRRLGCLVPVGHPLMDETLTDAIGAAPTPHQVAFLMWAAGPYQLRAGMWVLDGPRRDSVDTQLLAAIPETGLTDEDLTSVFTQLSVNPAFAEAVMRWLPRVQRTLGRWFVGQLAIPELSILALRDLGRPATVVEIIEHADMQRDQRSVTNRLQADERIVRVTKDTYGLREWGLEEYAGIADAIERAVTARGGIARVADLVLEISSAFGVSPTSVRAYAEAPMFVFEGDTVRMRRDEEPYTVRDQLPSRRQTYRFGPVIVLVVDVDRDVLRGSGRPVMSDVTQALGVVPGATRQFRGDTYAVTVSWPRTGWMGGSVGSLRDAVADVGAVLGQRLRLSFHVERGTVTAGRIDPAVLLDAPPIEALRRLTGAPGDTAEAVLESLDAALARPIAGVAATLRARGDGDAAELVRVLIGT